MNWHHCEDSNFVEFMKEQLLFHKIVDVKYDDQTAEITLDNGVELIAMGNEGCGGCSNGWYYLTHAAECDSAIMDVELVTEGDEKYSIFVMTEDKRINILTYEGHDNGYYGVGFHVEVVEKNSYNKGE